MRWRTTAARIRRNNQPLKWTGPANGPRNLESLPPPVPAIQRRSVMRRKTPREIKVRETIGACFVALWFGVAAVAAPLVADPVEVGGGWNLNGGGFTTVVAGLPPSEGNTYWGSTFNEPADVRLWKSFSSLTVQPGTYSLSIDTSAPFDSPYRATALSDFSQLGLLNVTSPRTVVSAPTPPGGTANWTAWSVSYFIPDGSADIGHPLGFNAHLQTTGFAYTTMLGPSSNRLSGCAGANVLGRINNGHCFGIASAASPATHNHALKRTAGRNGPCDSNAARRPGRPLNAGPFRPTANPYAEKCRPKQNPNFSLDSPQHPRDNPHNSNLQGV